MTVMIKRNAPRYELPEIYDMLGISVITANCFNISPFIRA